MQLLCWYCLCLKASARSNNASDLLLWEVTQSPGMCSLGCVFGRRFGPSCGDLLPLGEQGFAATPKTHCDSPEREIHRFHVVVTAELLSPCHAVTTPTPFCRSSHNGLLALMWHRGVLRCVQRHPHAWTRSRTGLAVEIILHKAEGCGVTDSTHIGQAGSTGCVSAKQEREVGVHSHTHTCARPSPH